MAHAQAPPSSPVVGQGWVDVGRVQGSPSLDGTLSVRLHSDDPANLLAAGEVCLLSPSGRVPFQVREATAIRTGGAGGAQVALRLAGLGDRRAAELWRGAAVCIPESALQPLEPEEYYWRQIVGLEVRLRDGRRLGPVTDIWPTAAHDLLVIGRGSDVLLVPAVEPILARVDLDAGELWIDPPVGLVPDVG